MAQSALRIVALFMPNDHHAAAMQARKAAHDRLVIAKGAVPCQGHEVFKHRFDIMFEMWPFRVPCDLRFLPCRQIGIGILQLLVRLVAQFGDFGARINVAITRSILQFKDARFERGNRLFKIEIYHHACGLEPEVRRVNVRVANG